MPAFAWLPDAAWRAALLLAVAFVVARLLRSQPAAVRHVLWTGVFAGVLAMPLLSGVSPVTLSVQVPDRVRSLAPVASGARAPDTEAGRPGGATTPERLSRSAPSVGTAAMDDPGAEGRYAAGLAGAPWSPIGLLAAAWLVGVAVLSLRLLAGFVALRRLVRRGLVPDESLARLVEAAAARAGVHALPRVLLTDGVAMPCTAGWIRPVILLPAEAGAWTPERLEVVLLHELSHVRRLDIVPHLVSELAVVIHWFNPLAWLAAARLRAEAERATDDRVVQAGARPSEYADHLLEIVRQSRPAWYPAPLMPLARRTEFEGRLLSILESRGAMPSARGAMVVVAIAAALSVGVASMEGAVQPASTDDPASGVMVPDELVAEAAADPSAVPTPPTRVPAGQGGDESTVSALSEALRDPVASVRQAAAEALGRTRDSVAVRALMDVLRADESAAVRRAAAWSLGEIADAMAIPALADALLRDRDIEVRRNAASALGHIDDQRATSALTRALEQDADANVRMRAAEALSTIDDEGALDALIRVLDRDDDPGVRRAVIEAIDNLESARALPAVSRALRDGDADVRRAAADALGSMDDRDAVPALLAVARDAEAEVRHAAINALGSLGDRRAVPAFTAALSDGDVEVRRAAAQAFASIENLRTAPPELIRAMNDRDAEVRHAVAHALGHIEDPAAIRALIARVGDANTDVRRAVVESLDQFDDPSVVAALRTALKDSDPEVRQRAAQALGNRKRGGEGGEGGAGIQ